MTIDDVLETLQEKKRLGEIHGDETFCIISGENVIAIPADITVYSRDLVGVECEIDWVDEDLD
jgi:hypothetical protein